MSFIVTGNIESGFETTIKISQGQTDPIDLVFTDNGKAISLKNANLVMRINSPVPMDLNIKNEGITIVEEKSGRARINISEIPADFPPGLYPFDTWAVIEERKISVLSGYIEITKRITPL